MELTNPPIPNLSAKLSRASDSCREIATRVLHPTRLRLPPRALIVAALWLSALMLHAGSSVWTGGAGDNSWHSPANWADNRVPPATNDVVISVPATTTILHRIGSTSVRSLQCTASLSLAGAGFSLTAGSSLIQGSLTSYPTHGRLSQL